MRLLLRIFILLCVTQIREIASGLCYRGFSTVLTGFRMLTLFPVHSRAIMHGDLSGVRCTSSFRFLFSLVAYKVTQANILISDDQSALLYDFGCRHWFGIWSVPWCHGPRQNHLWVLRCDGLHPRYSIQRRRSATSATYTHLDQFRSR